MIFSLVKVGKQWRMKNRFAAQAYFRCVKDNLSEAIVRLVEKQNERCAKPTGLINIRSETRKQT